jgi:anti-sigma B factor antagonist
MAQGGDPRRKALTNPLADSPGMHVSSTYDGTGRITVEVDGEVDVAAVDQLRTTLDQAIDTGVRQLVIDLRGVSFLGSDGLDCLARASRSAEAAGCHLYTVASNRVVVRPIEITGLGPALRLCDRLAAVPSPSMDE